VDLKGKTLPDSPKVSGTVAVDWDAFAGEKTRFAVHVDTSYASAQYFEPFNVPRLKQDAYALLNARLSLYSGGGHWNAGVWGRNLTDKFYVTSAADVSGIGFDYFHRGAPRTYGVDFNISF
jgi:iron complex outermembrane receptor protein